VRPRRLFLQVRLASEADTATLGSVADRLVRRRQLPVVLRSGLNFLVSVGGSLAHRVSAAEASRSKVW